MEVVVTGSRELFYAEQFFDPEQPRVKSRQRADKEVHERLDALHKHEPITLLVCGGAQGPDTAAWAWAWEHGIPTRIFEPNWRKHPKLAGFKRNWHMLFHTAGPRVQRASQARTRCINDLESLVKKTSQDKSLMRCCPTALHEVVECREALLDPEHPKRRSKMLEMGLPLPHARVVAFWDKRSKGTKQCIKAALLLGYEVVVYEYPRPPLPTRAEDLARIDNRSDTGGAPSFAAFTEQGCGKD